MKKLAFERNFYDAVIVGARCAGAATAMLLAKGGARVLVVDRQPYGSDTLSTHALMRPAVIQLSRWGLLDRLIASGAPVITETSFHYADEQVTIPIREEPGIPGLVAPRRTILDRTLVDAARAAGAQIVHDTIVESLTHGANGQVNGVVLRDLSGNRAQVGASIVVGADGIGSTVARQAGARIVARARHCLANIFGYAPIAGNSGYHWHFQPGFSAGAIPTHDDRACIFVSASTAHFDSHLRHDPPASHRHVLRRVAPAIAEAVPPQALSQLRIFRGVPGLIREAYGPGWVLAGDSGFFRDPITSHGISDALRDSEAAANAILAGTEYDLRRYRDERDHFAYPMLEVTDAISSLEWSLDDLKQLHRKFSAILKEEAAALAQRQERTVVAPDASADDNRLAAPVRPNARPPREKTAGFRHDKQGVIA